MQLAYNKIKRWYKDMRVINTISSQKNISYNMSNKKDANLCSDKKFLFTNFKKSKTNNLTYKEIGDIPYKRIYNNATLKSYDKKNNNLDDYEIDKEVNMRLYKEHHLDEEGIEFGSNEFKEWMIKNQENFIVPIDAPAKIRKTVYDMVDSAKEPAKFYILKEFTRGFKKIKDHSDLNSYMNVTDKILKDKKDYLNLLKMNETDDSIIKKAIKNVTELVKEITTFKNNLKDVILDYKTQKK